MTIFDILREHLPDKDFSAVKAITPQEQQQVVDDARRCFMTDHFKICSIPDANACKNSETISC